MLTLFGPCVSFLKWWLHVTYFTCQISRHKILVRQIIILFSCRKWGKQWKISVRTDSFDQDFNMDLRHKTAGWWQLDNDLHQACWELLTSLLPHLHDVTVNCRNDMGKFITFGISCNRPQELCFLVSLSSLRISCRTSAGSSLKLELLTSTACKSVVAQFLWTWISSSELSVSSSGL